MILPWERPHEEWQRVPLWALLAWLAFYALFLLHACTEASGFLLLDHVNLVFHEMGHPAFSYFGETMMLLGGTLGELLVPLGIAVSFWWRRHTTGVAFCAFWFFENFLYIGTYMADARLQELPLVGGGDHDWFLLFSRWGLILLDKVIAARTRQFGWAGMLLTIAWLVWMYFRQEPQLVPISPGPRAVGRGKVKYGDELNGPAAPR